jgi:hypothetical protein
MRTSIEEWLRSEYVALFTTGFCAIAEIAPAMTSRVSLFIIVWYPD